MSGTWQTFLEKLSETTESGTDWKTEICDCKDGMSQLFYLNSDKSFSISGCCNQSNFCAQIMKDKHLAKIDNRIFQKQQNHLKKKQKRVERKYSSKIARKPAARISRNCELKKEPAISFESLTTFFKS